MPVTGEKREVQSRCPLQPQNPYPPALPGMAPVPQVRVRRRAGTFARSYPLKRQVSLLKVQLEEVAYEGQARGPRRIVLWTPPVEEISQEEKDDGPQQDSARTERGPEGSRQGAQRLQHGCAACSPFRGPSLRRSLRGLCLPAASTALLPQRVGFPGPASPSLCAPGLFLSLWCFPAPPPPALLLPSVRNSASPRPWRGLASSDQVGQTSPGFPPGPTSCAPRLPPPNLHRITPCL